MRKNIEIITDDDSITFEEIKECLEKEFLIPSFDIGNFGTSMRFEISKKNKEKEDDLDVMLGVVQP